MACAGAMPFRRDFVAPTRIYGPQAKHTMMHGNDAIYPEHGNDLENPILLGVQKPQIKTRQYLQAQDETAISSFLLPI